MISRFAGSGTGWEAERERKCNGKGGKGGEKCHKGWNKERKGRGTGKGKEKGKDTFKWPRIERRGAEKILSPSWESMKDRSMAWCSDPPSKSSVNRTLWSFIINFNKAITLQRNQPQKLRENGNKRTWICRFPW